MSYTYPETAIDSHLVNLSGPLNISRSGAVVQLFRNLSQSGVEGVVVNLEEVPFIDSRGLAALIAGYKIFGSDARNFRLIGVQDQPRLIFELTGFDHVFQADAHAGNGRAELMALAPHIQVMPGHCSSNDFVEVLIWPATERLLDLQQ